MIELSEFKQAVRRLAELGDREAAKQLAGAIATERVRAFELAPAALPESFTLKQARDAWVEQTGGDIDAVTFRYRILKLVRATGETEKGARGKAAALYERI